MVWEEVWIRDNRQCYACGQMDHIAKFCQIQPAQQGRRCTQRRPFNNMESIDYEKVEKEVSGNKDHLVALLVLQSEEKSKLKEING